MIVINLNIEYLLNVIILVNSYKASLNEVPDS